jgi:hypothetical protein
MTMTHGVTRGEAWRAAQILADQRHDGRADWYAGETDDGPTVISPGGPTRPGRQLTPVEAVTLARALYGMQAARGEGRYS